jgi:abequosyltransferase
MGRKVKSPDSAKPLLTIAIPTYNRAGYLKELLSILADQLKDEPRVELIISDNASPDETP